MEISNSSLIFKKINKLIFYVFAFISFLILITVIYSALNLYGIFFSLIFGCRLNKEDNSFMFIMKAELNCPFRVLPWFVTPLFGLFGLLLFISLLLLFIHLFPKTARKIPIIKKYLDYLNFKSIFWQPVNQTKECFICKEQNKELGTMCSNKQHTLCLECSKNWILSQVEDDQDITCPYCRQNV